MIKKQSIQGTDGLKAQGPYSMGMRYGDTLYLSAILPIDESSEIVSEDIKKQAIQVVENIERLLEAYDCDLSHVLRTEVSITDMDDYAIINQVFAIYFSHPYPARSIVEVKALPKGAKIQMQCTVAFGDVVVEEDMETCETCD